MSCDVEADTSNEQYEGIDEQPVQPYQRTTADVLVFRCGSEEPDEQTLPLSDDIVSVIQVMLQAPLVQSMPLSYGMTLFFDEYGEARGKPVNECLARCAPPNYAHFHGDVMLVCCDQLQENYGSAESAVWRDVNKKYLNSFKEALHIEQEAQEQMQIGAEQIGLAIISGLFATSE